MIIVLGLPENEGKKLGNGVGAKNKGRSPTEKIESVIDRLMKTGFWGELTISFKNGSPVLMEKKEQTKL